MSAQAGWVTVAMPGERYTLAEPTIAHHPTRAEARRYAAWLRAHPATTSVEGTVRVLSADEYAAEVSA